MKIKEFLYLLPFLCIFLCISQKTAESCPTCVGKIDEQSEPFFTNECYECDFGHTDFSATNTNS